jgi:uncharacterized protein with ATP-grasp and redox domains
MRTSYECIPCLLQSIIRLFKNNLIKEDKREIIIKKILEDLAKESLDCSPPAIAQKMYGIIKKETENEDPYKAIKRKYNKLCLGIYEKLKNKVKNNKKPMYEALKLSIVGNIIDFGPNHSFSLIEKVAELENINLRVDDSKNLFNDIKNARSILFLGDNAGEIVFDRLFLETINHPNVIYAVRGMPILNDSTKEDASVCGMNKLVKVIDTGTDFPGIDLEQSSSEIKNVYKDADLIIAKGHGNYESLCEVINKKIYFLLIAKCDLVAKQLGVKKDDIVAVSNNGIYKSNLNTKKCKKTD